MSNRSGGGEPTWKDLEEAFTRLASEALIPQRLKKLRERAGLKQAELARKLEDAGAPIPQPSISRMEALADAGKARQARPVTVNEALALAKVLGVSFSELVLPDGALPELEVSRAFSAAAERFHTAWAALSAYESAAQDAAQLLRQHPMWRHYLEMHTEVAWDKKDGGMRQDDPLLPPEWAPTDNVETLALLVDLLDRALPDHEDRVTTLRKRWADVGRRARNLRSEEDAAIARQRHEEKHDRNRKGGR